MKKIIYSIALVAAFGFAAQSQTSDPAGTKKDKPKSQETVKPDGTTSPAEPSSTEPKKRMAITEKGVPASKAREKDSKENKTTEPKAQPAHSQK